MYVLLKKRKTWVSPLMNIYILIHISKIIHKANNVLGTIKQTFNSRGANLIRLLYTTLVRPILDYSSTIWNLHQMGVIHELEMFKEEPLN